MAMKTQNEIADQIGIKQPTLSNILNGNRGMSWDLAKRFSAVFGNEPGWWMEGTPDQIREAIKEAA